MSRINLECLFNFLLCKDNVAVKKCVRNSGFMSITICILPISFFVLSLLSCDFLKILKFFNAFNPEKYFYPLFALFTVPAVRFPRIPSSRHELQRPESGASSNLQPLPAASGSGQQAHPPTSCLVHVPSKLPSYKTT